MMATVYSTKKLPISPFALLLATLSSQLRKDDVRKICTQLQGLVDKKSLDAIKDGRSLLGVLQKQGFLNSKKLSLLRKSFVDSKLLYLVDLIDEFKRERMQLFNVPTGKEEKEQRQKALQEVFERQQNEVTNCYDVGENLRRKLQDTEVALDNQKRAIIVAEDAKNHLVEKMKVENKEKRFLEETLNELQDATVLEERQLKDILDLLKTENIEKNKLSPKKENKLNESELEENNKNVSLLRKLSDEKQSSLSKAKEREQDLKQSLKIKNNLIRSLAADILKTSDELISLEKRFIKSLEDKRKEKKAFAKNDLDLFDIQRELEETEEEIQRTKKGIYIPLNNPNMMQNHSRSLTLKILDYANALEENSYSFGELGSNTFPTQFNFPCSVAIDINNNIYVADHMNQRIHKLDVWGNPVAEPLDLGNTHPVAIAVNKHGNIIITDSHVVKVFSSNGVPSHNFLPLYKKKDKRPQISALAVDKEGNILIADKNNHRIQKFRIDGLFICFIGGPDGLDSPSGIAVTSKGEIIVSELNASQIKLFNNLGTSYNVLGKEGIGKVCFGNPRGLALDRKGNILVADTANHRIQVLTPRGEYIGSLGRLGSSCGCLDSPYAIAINYLGHVVVADTGNHRVTVFT